MGLSLKATHTGPLIVITNTNNVPIAKYDGSTDKMEIMNASTAEDLLRSIYGEHIESAKQAAKGKVNV